MDDDDYQKLLDIVTNEEENTTQNVSKMLASIILKIMRLGMNSM